MNNKDRIDNHEIFSSMSEVVASYIKKCDIAGRERAPATTAEQYSINCFGVLRSVTNCLDQLVFAAELLSGYRRQLTPNTMNRHDYIVYGIENYYLRITSIYDRCLRVTNVVFQLGLPERECRNSTILKNSHVKNTHVAKSLKALDKFTDQFRVFRNTIAHSETFDDQEGMGILASYYFLEDQGAEEIIRYKHLYKKETDDYIRKKKEEFIAHITELCDLIFNFFNHLKSQYEARFKIYV